MQVKSDPYRAHAEGPVCGSVERRSGIIGIQIELGVTVYVGDLDCLLLGEFQLGMLWALQRYACSWRAIRAAPKTVRFESWNVPEHPTRTLRSRWHESVCRVDLRHAADTVVVVPPSTKRPINALDLANFGLGCQYGSRPLHGIVFAAKESVFSI